MNKKTIDFIERHFVAITALLFWVIFIIAFYSYKISHDLSYFDLVKRLYFYVAQNPVGPLIYILVYTLRPLLFFPSALLTLISGILYGFSGGIIFTIIGENASAGTGYLIGRLLGKKQADSDEKSIMNDWQKNLKEHDFMAILIMRLIYMPFDLTNFICGWLHINWLRYTIATFLGIIPSVIIWVSISDSIENIESFDPSQIHLKKEQLIISGVLLLISLIFAKWLHSKKKKILK